MESGEGDGEVVRWLVSNGWSPGRDIGDRADELILARVDVARQQGVELIAVPAARKIIHSYGMLELARPGASGSVIVMSPMGGYGGDVHDISELSSDLGSPVFPVGFDPNDYALVLVDETGRFFSLHHTGAYFMGKNDMDAFRRFMHGIPDDDAEPYFQL